MKVLRRSLKSDREKSSHISITPKSAVAIVPPKKVIRALYDYEAQSRYELSFQKGDFFHVINRENDPNWYEACNPAVPAARGIVPVAYFEALGKTERDSTQSQKSPLPVRLPDHDSGYSDSSRPATMSPPDTARSSKSLGKGATVYGVVMYDFVSERPDELDAKAGEAIIVIAQSNPEWFVAKPIGRLGGPGLIPVSFIEIRDMVTGQAVEDPLEAVQRARVPKVEEWKKMAADYKNSSISLGKFEMATSPQQQQKIEQGMQRLSLQSRQTSGNSSAPMRTSNPGYQVQQETQSNRTVSSLPTPISARIPRYNYANEKYWFIIETKHEDGKCWELSRYYEDFYDFQIKLLSEFPAEAGSTGQHRRTLPYMPGPVSYVTNAITEGRQNNLDAYVKNLLAQPAYISRCHLVKEFFAPRPGDCEIGPDVLSEGYRLSNGSRPSSNDSGIDAASRQSSRGNLDRGSNYAGLSAGPQRNEVSIPEAYPFPSELPQQPAMKVKIYYGEDTIAIRVPSDIQFAQLSEKIRERLKIPSGEPITLSYRDESSGDRPLMLSNNDLDLALQRNEKLIVYVE